MELIPLLTPQIMIKIYVAVIMIGKISNCLFKKKQIILYLPQLIISIVSGVFLTLLTSFIFFYTTIYIFSFFSSSRTSFLTRVSTLTWDFLFPVHFYFLFFLSFPFSLFPLISIFSFSVHFSFLFFRSFLFSFSVHFYILLFDSTGKGPSLRNTLGVLVAFDFFL